MVLKANPPAAVFRGRVAPADDEGSMASKVNCAWVAPRWCAQFLSAQTMSPRWLPQASRSEEHTSELQSHLNLVCRLLLEKKTGPWPSLSEAILVPSCEGTIDWMVCIFSPCLCRSSA